MFRKATPVVARHVLRRGATSAAARRAIATNVISTQRRLMSSTRPLSTLSQNRFKSSVAVEADDVCVPTEHPPFKKILAANRGEIATRINRAGAELGVQTAGIYSYEGE